jgi:hypothetical protein
MGGDRGRVPVLGAILIEMEDVEASYASALGPAWFRLGLGRSCG